MVLRWRESSAIMIIVIFIAFIQAIIIFDYSETPTPPRPLRPTLQYGHLVITAASFWPPGKTVIHFRVQKKTSFGRIDGHLLIRPNFFGPLMTILTGFHCIIF